MIWVNIAVPVIKMDIWMYRQSILYIVPIGLSMVITVCSLVPLMFNLNCTVAATLDIWYKADRFDLYMGIAPERYYVSYAWLGSI